MQLETDEWMTASEAARLFGVSHQRVHQMADDDGTLDVIRPWPHVMLVGRTSVRRWLDGHRQARILPADARRFVLEHSGAKTVHTLTEGDIEGWLVGFIADARPRWDAARQVQWAAEMAARLLTTGAA